MKREAEEEWGEGEVTLKIDRPRAESLYHIGGLKSVGTA
jgi:hypothetical protein